MIKSNYFGTTYTKLTANLKFKDFPGRYQKKKKVLFQKNSRPGTKNSRISRFFAYEPCLNFSFIISVIFENDSKFAISESDNFLTIE